MNGSEFDRRFDAGDTVTGELDLESAMRPRQKQKRVNVDFPFWMVEQLDPEVTRLGVIRQSLIKIWLAKRLEHRYLSAKLSACDAVHFSSKALAL